MNGKGWMQFVLLGAAAALFGLGWDIASTPIEFALTSANPMLIPAPEIRPPIPLAASIARLESLSATRDRPVFAPTRRPPSQAAQAAGPQAADAVSIELIGTLTGPGGRHALLRVRETQVGVWVGVGESTEGWRVASIAKDSVIVEAAGQSLELTLYQTKVPNRL